MSRPDEKITIRLRLGGAEFQLEGSRQTVLDMLESDLPKILEAMTKLTPHSPPTPPLPTSLGGISSLEEAENLQPSSPLSPQGVDPYPAISAKRCGDAVVGLISSDWGRRKPRTLSEIKEALDANALHYSGRVIGFTLTRLTRRGRVRRWKTEEGYIYTAASESR